MILQAGTGIQARGFLAALFGFVLLGAAPPFDQEMPPAAPDYTLTSSWAARGGGADLPADVFYIQPTTFRSQRWNQDIADTETNVWTDVSVTTRQLSAFATCCRLYQPRYRQASSRAFVEISGDGPKAYALAYGDVRRAFRAFLAQTGQRPFILAGHSQGALHAMRLLESEIAGTPARQRLVAVYAPGIGIPIGQFGTNIRGIAPCALPSDTGCVISWNSFLPEADVSEYVARSSASYIARYGDTPGKALLCINPLTFNAHQPAAPQGANRGALLGTVVAGPLPPLLPGIAAATCAGGVLRVTSAPGAPTLDPLPGGSLHMYDIALFWANLRDDAAGRVAVFLRRRTSS